MVQSRHGGRHHFPGFRIPKAAVSIPHVTVGQSGTNHLLDPNIFRILPSPQIDKVDIQPRISGIALPRFFRYLGIALDVAHIAQFEVIFLHACPDVHRELSCEVVPALTVYSGVDVYASGTKELVMDLTTSEEQS